MIGIIKNLTDSEILQHDIDSLVEWSNEWKMLFNFDKCKVMTITKSNKKTYTPIALTMTINSTTNEKHNLLETKVEKDQGIYLNSNLKCDSQAKYAAAKANQVLGMLKRTFRIWTIKSFKKLYTAYVRPHLEYAVSVWSPYRKKDIHIIEQIQRRATKIVPKLKNLKYHEPQRTRTHNIGNSTNQR